MQLIALGSSIKFDPVGEPQDVVGAALTEIERRIGGLTSVSRLYGTKAWPDPSQPSFVNAAARLDCNLEPVALLDALLSIELDFGRRRSVPNAPRTLDLDVIAVDDQVIEQARLQLPHPRMQDRVFVLQPLCDVAPLWRHPQTKQTTQEMLAQIKANPTFDPTDIWPLAETPDQ